MAPLPISIVSSDADLIVVISDTLKVPAMRIRALVSTDGAV